MVAAGFIVLWLQDHSCGGLLAGMESQAGGRFEQLLLAAAAAYAELGYHQASVKNITERAGVAAGTYYLYFENKPASAIAIINRLYELTLQEIIRYRQKEPDDVIAKLGASIAAVMRSFGHHPDMAKVALIQAPGADPTFDARLTEIHAELTGLVAKDLAEALASGKIPEQDVRLSARCLVGSIYEVLIGWIRDGEPSDLEAAIPGVIEYSLRGIGAVVT